jgi:hypothetical protein
MNKLEQKVRVILAGKPFISTRSLRNNFSKEVVSYFVEHANELGYYFCANCGYYVIKENYNERFELCNDCKEGKDERQRRLH